MENISTSQNWLEKLLPEGTPEGQSRAIADDKELVTVSAGAGTGKTWVLSNRFAHLLLSDPDCLPQNILTLTFTDAAAAEMRDRIQKRVLALIKDDQDGLKNLSPERAKAIHEGFDEAWISTIHSFAARLISESGLSLHIDPRSGVVSQPQEDEFWGAFEQALDFLSLKGFAASFGGQTLKLAKSLDDNPVLMAALGHWGAAKLCSLAQSTVEMHSSLGHSPETLLRWADEAEKPDDPQSAAAAEAVNLILKPLWIDAWEQWKQVFQELGGQIAAEYNKKARTKSIVPLYDTMEKWGSLSDENPDDESLRQFFLDATGKIKGGNSKILSAVKEILGCTVGDWQKNISFYTSLSQLPNNGPYYCTEAERLLRSALLRLCALAWILWRDTKQRLGLLSFSDMIRFAGDSLENVYQLKEFKHVMVDEFQDTDPLQFSMLNSIKEKENSKLFLVGDPKQSIYKFRHADLTLFAEMIRRADSDIALDVSFRTRRKLMERLNSLFSGIWQDGLGSSPGMENLVFIPLDVPVSPESEPEREQGSIPPFSVLVTVREGRPSVLKYQAGQLAETLKAYVAEGRTIWDKNEKRLRPVQWKDCAVLTLRRSPFRAIEAAFEEAAIPFFFEKDTDFFSRGEARDVISLLRAASDPTDDTALAGWLSSPLSGFEQQTVFEVLMHRASGRDLQRIPLYSVLKEALPEAAEALSRMQLMGNLKGPSAVVSELLRDRRWLSGYRASDRLRVLRNTANILELVLGYENGLSSGAAMQGCSRWLESALKREAKSVEPNFTEPDSDAVRITTVHSSKGLEYPVTAIFCTNRKRPSVTLEPSKALGVVFSSFPAFLDEAVEPSEIEIDISSLDIDMSYIKTDFTDEEEKSVGTEKTEQPCSLLWERAISEQSDSEEDERLFYVAATRAQEALIISGIINKGSKDDGIPLSKLPNGNWISPVLEMLAEEQDCEDCLSLNGDEIHIVHPVAESEDKSLLNKIIPNDENITENNSVPEELDLPLSGEDVMLSSISATSFALYEWCPLAWRRRYRQGLDLRWEIPDGGDDDGLPGGAELGSLAHWILARSPFNDEELSFWLESPKVLYMLPAALRETWNAPASKEALSIWLRDFYKTDTALMLDTMPLNDIHRETSFRVFSGVQRLCLAGAMDVVWEDNENPGFWHVLDYKISTSANAPVELYMTQLSFYALALRALLLRDARPFNGVDVGLVFLREKGELKFRKAFPVNYQWDELEAQVRAAAHGAAAGDWAPCLQHCAVCPWDR